MYFPVPALIHLNSLEGYNIGLSNRSVRVFVLEAWPIANASQVEPGAC